MREPRCPRCDAPAPPTGRGEPARFCRRCGEELSRGVRPRPQPLSPSAVLTLVFGTFAIAGGSLVGALAFLEQGKPLVALLVAAGGLVAAAGFAALDLYYSRPR